MKKTLTAVVAVILTLALTVCSFAAAEKKDVAEELRNTADYITNGITAYTVDSAADYFYLALSGAGADYYEGFLQSVTENLSENSGKIIPLYGESMTTYAAVAGIIGAMGGDPTNVNSVDLTALLAGADVTSISNPYHYNIVIPVAAKYCDASVVKAVCDSFIANYYTPGSGMDYWGFASDNTAMFISAVAQSGLDLYADVLEDAIAVLDTYKTDGGYCYNPEYGTEANADSTGLALMAKCKYYEYKGTVNENLAELDAIYADLLTFKGETAGSFISYGAESTYAATDAFRGIAAYYDVLPESTSAPKPEAPDGNGGTDNGTAPAPEKPSQSPAVMNPEIPNTGSEFSVASAAAVALAALFGTALLKKKEN